MAIMPLHLSEVVLIRGGRKILGPIDISFAPAGTTVVVGPNGAGKTSLLRALNTAAGMNAYILADRATWLKFANKADLKLLFEGDPDLFNQYAYLPVSKEKRPHVKADASRDPEDWLTSETAKGLIDGYRISGQQFFHFNATASKPAG